MSYLDTRITRDEFIKTRGVTSTQANARTSLNLFDHFCSELYQKNGESIVLDIEKAISDDGNYDRLIRLTNSFVQWLLEVHLDIMQKKCITNNSKDDPCPPNYSKNSNYERECNFTVYARKLQS